MPWLYLFACGWMLFQVWGPVDSSIQACGEGFGVVGGGCVYSGSMARRSLLSRGGVGRGDRLAPERLSLKVRVDRVTLAKLREVARMDGLAVSTVVRRAINAYLRPFKAVVVTDVSTERDRTTLRVYPVGRSFRLSLQRQKMRNRRYLGALKGEDSMGTNWAREVQRSVSRAVRVAPSEDWGVGELRLGAHALFLDVQGLEE